MSELTFLALAGADYEVGIAADRVRRIAAAGDFHDGEPLELAALLPALAAAGADGEAAARVLLVELRGGSVLPLRTAAAIVVRSVEAAALMRLPGIVTRGARFICGVVFAAAPVPALVVVDPDILSEALAGGAPAGIPDSLEELW
jgi:hypothetical protein